MVVSSSELAERSLRNSLRASSTCVVGAKRLLCVQIYCAHERLNQLLPRLLGADIQTDIAGVHYELFARIVNERGKKTIRKSVSFCLFAVCFSIFRLFVHTVKAPALAAA